MSDYKTPSSKRKTKKGRHKDKWNRNGKYTTRGLRIKESRVYQSHKKITINFNCYLIKNEIHSFIN